ncbi:hypothetical protein MMC22_002937 [Lobaria immixta]|nr:hypothetical protein [Lobaria immixta]
MGRVRRKWTAEEHTLLGNAVTKAQEDGRPLIWHEIAACVPGRTNKDCRKRWYGKTATKVKKGPWTSLEDARLFKAVKQHGTRWSVVAPEVKTRTGDQCSKRWSYTLNPDIDRSAWTPMEDELLLDGVNEYGRSWQQITSIYFPRRTSLGAKNRYHLLRRRSEGARSYSKSPLAQVSDTGPTTVHGSDESLGTDQSDSFDSEDETDEHRVKEHGNISAHMNAPEDQVSNFGFGAGLEAQPDARALEPDTSSSLSGERPNLAPASGSQGQLADPDNSTLQCTPLSNVDFSNYANVAPSTKRTPQSFRQTCAMASLPQTPPSTFGENANSTTQNTDNFAVNHSPDVGAALSWEDQALYDTSMLFPNQHTMLGFDPSFAHNNTVIEPSTAVVPFSSEVAAMITPAATPISFTTAAQPSISVPGCRPSYSSSPAYSSESACYVAEDEIRGGENIRRITIEAVCFKDDLRTIVQAVTELSLMAVVKTDD